MAGTSGNSLSNKCPWYTSTGCTLEWTDLVNSGLLCEHFFQKCTWLDWLIYHWCNSPTLFSYFHYGDVIMGAIASQITSFTIVYSTVYSDADQRKHQSSASLAFVRLIHRGPVNSPHKWTVTRKMFPFDDVIMSFIVVVMILSSSTYSIMCTHPSWTHLHYKTVLMIHNLCWTGQKPPSMVNKLADQKMWRDMNLIYDEHIIIISYLCYYLCYFVDYNHHRHCKDLVTYMYCLLIVA